MAETLTLAFPKKSHRKKVKIPSFSPKLAEFFGIMMGDGGINNPWQANVTLNSTTDVPYSRYVIRLCRDLFDITPAVRKRNGSNAVVISLASTTIVDFLVQNGLPRDNKLRAGLSIPRWILSEPVYRVACMRGLVDTDGFLYIHRHRVRGKEYVHLGLRFTSASPRLI